MISFCDSSSNSQPAAEIPSPFDPSEEYYFPYNLQKADSEYKLPSYLEEISGLSYCQSGKLACVQDEKATIYVLELGEKLKISTHKFGKDGDFEDISVNGKTIYVLRNDGRIYRVKNFQEDDKKVKKYKTQLSEKNDTEGMAFDPLSNSLLIACKGSPSLSKENKYKGNRAVYKFDLESEELLTDPYLLINLDNLDSYRDQSSFKRFSAKLAKRLQLVESETSFNPSGISIHPVYGDIYLISSIGKLMVVMDRRGKILDIQDLDEKLFRQPEGICFSPSGDMYIANEGQGGKGYILKFNHKSND